MKNKQQKILIIEDDAWLAQNYIRVFEKRNYIVKVTDNATQAIDLIDSLQPDAIVLDLLISDTTAFPLLHEIRSYTDISEIPIIICSNLASELTLSDLAPYGVKKIIDKTTMLPEDLVAAIKMVVRD